MLEIVGIYDFNTSNDESCRYRQMLEIVGMYDLITLMNNDSITPLSKIKLYQRFFISKELVYMMNSLCLIFIEPISMVFGHWN